jgi:5S rRNA maturation endonuclease (ribonuclease M5)
MKNKKINQEKLEEIIKELDGKLIVVEGKKDEKALKSLGLKDIIAISGRPLYEITEIALNTKKEVVILTDFDKKGREMGKKLKDLLQRRGKPPNSRLRWKVMALGKNRIEDFGGIFTPETLSLREDDYHVKTCTNFNKICHKGGNRRTRGNRKT